jgi:hypothetical protein
MPLAQRRRGSHHSYGDSVQVRSLGRVGLVGGVANVGREQNVAMATTLRFTIGDAFPADDPVARFVTVLAMMSNDWSRLVDQMLRVEDLDKDAAGLRVMSFRHQAALHIEAATFIRDARRRFPDVAIFVAGLDDAAQRCCDLILEGVDSTSPRYLGDWLTDHRNVTFHYPQMHPTKAAHGQEEITEALRSAADKESMIRIADNPHDLRFDFADEVVVQWLPDDDESDLIVRLREAVLALADFVREAAQAYLNSRPPGTFSRA